MGPRSLRVAAGRCTGPTPNKACRPRTPTFKHAIRACRVLPGGVEPLTFGTYRVLEGWGAWPAGLVRGGSSAATCSDPQRPGPHGWAPQAWRACPKRFMLRNLLNGKWTRFRFQSIAKIMDVDVQNIKKRVVLYPIYVNSKKTLAEGRRINASKACENLLPVLRFMNSPGPGKQLMVHVADLVPQHPGRTKKQEPASTSAASTSKSGKGGKKKR
ncbi:hypothetical protein BUALT_Bualt12G0104200 [Buddleja alternifolia]|uniref:Uncharacterized protein n=1 Tax=Buddleja alternifolia TaxID=168488 RepID=A0AAV6WXE7_9LAMI|nr:hypothetical protein BUALT_Bualt12G0104200 [Buddleja alternifolia]